MSNTKTMYDLMREADYWEEDACFPEDWIEQSTKSDKEKYFEPVEEENNTKPEKGLDKCQRFIGFEIFVDYDEEALSKLVEFNIQGNNIYYGGFYIKDNKLICPNFIEPNEYFNDLYNTILTDLDIDVE